MNYDHEDWSCKIIGGDTDCRSVLDSFDKNLAKDIVSGKEVHELSELVSGKASGRVDASEITLFKSVGTGIQDIALAAVIYQRAQERDVGKPIGVFPYPKKN